MRRTDEPEISHRCNIEKRAEAYRDAASATNEIAAFGAEAVGSRRPQIVPRLANLELRRR